jgi:hypothetical protein
MFNYNLRSATALLTIISILGPNSVYAMESDIDLSGSIELSRSLTLSRAPILEPENEVQSPPSSLSTSIPLDSQEQPEGWLGTIYSYTLAPVVNTAAKAGELMTDYTVRPVVNAATGASQLVADYAITPVVNASSAVANALSEGASGTRSAAKAFSNGVDLYPTIQHTGALAVPAMRQAGQDALDYWNQPSADYPAAMKNIMEGFAQEMGPNLHHLLINANRILGPEFTADIVQRMGLTQKAGTMVANNMMKFSNPLGWGTTLVTLTQMGFNLAHLTQNGLFGLAKMEIAKIAAKKAGLPEDYMKLQQEALKTEQIFDEEQEKWHQYQIEHPAVEDENSWAITNWVVRYNNHSDNAHSYPRNKEWKEAEQASLEAKKNLTEATDDFYAKKGEIKGTFLMVAYEKWVKGLENTLRKTLTSFANDLEARLTVDQNIPASAAPLVKNALRAFILGSQEPSGSAVKQGKELTSQAKEITDAVSTVAKNPMTVLRNLTPEVVANAANDLSNTINAGVGHVLGTAASKITEETIRGLNLSQIQMFRKSELNLDINKLIQNGQLPDTVKTALDYTDGFFDFDQLAQQLLQKAGTQAAVRFSDILGNFVLERVNEASSKQYTLEELMTQEIDYSLTTRSRNYITSWFK